MNTAVAAASALSLEKSADTLPVQRRRFHYFRNLFRKTQKKIVNLLLQGAKLSPEYRAEFSSREDLHDYSPRCYAHITEMESSDLFTFSEKLSLYISITSWNSFELATDKYHMFFYAITHRILEIGDAKKHALQVELEAVAADTAGKEDLRKLIVFTNTLYHKGYIAAIFDSHVGRVQEGLLKLRHAQGTQSLDELIADPEIREIVFSCTQSGLFKEMLDINAYDASNRLQKQLEKIDSSGRLESFIKMVTGSCVLTEAFALKPLFDYIEAKYDDAVERGGVHPIDRLSLSELMHESDTEEEEEKDESERGQCDEEKKMDDDTVTPTPYDTIKQLNAHIAELEAKIRWMETKTPTMEPTEEPNV